MLTKFEDFLFEARLSDIINMDKSNLGNIDINKYANVNFEDKPKYLKRIVFGKDIYKIEYNDKEKHSIKKRIIERSNFKNIEEFNEFLKKLLTELHDDHSEEFKKHNKEIILYVTEYDFYMIFYINHSKQTIKLVTILNKRIRDEETKNIIQMKTKL